MASRRHGPPPGLQFTRSLEETAEIQDFVRGRGKRDEFSWIDAPLRGTQSSGQSVNPTKCSNCRHWLGELSKKWGKCEVCGTPIVGEGEN